VIALEDVTSRLAAAGFVAAHDEAKNCSTVPPVTAPSRVDARTSSPRRATRLDHGVHFILRRTSTTRSWGVRSALAERTAGPARSTSSAAKGSAVDLCTGSGAIAMVVQTERPNARVVATDLDEVAVNCAASNGVKVYCGDLFAPLPRTRGRVDVVVGVVPYVPTKSMSLLPRDTFVFESTLAYDGGDDGAEILRRVIRESTLFLRAVAH